MSNFKVKNGLNVPTGTPAVQGDINVESTAGLQTYHNGAVRTHVDTNSTQTLTNKTLTSPAITTPTGIVKGDVGLGNVDNTSDANKPVSTATQTALDLKADLASPALTGNPTAPTQSAGTNNTRIATTAYADALVSDTAYAGSWDTVTGISPSKNAVYDQMELRAPKASPTFSGTITTPLTASRALVTGSSSELAVSATTATELGYVNGVTSAIQTQLDSKVGITAVDSAKTTTYTVETSDTFVPVDATSGAFTVTLYAASGNSGRRVTFKKTDATVNAVTIDGNSSETIDGNLTWKLVGKYDFLTLVCNGSNWHIENGRTTSIVIVDSGNGHGGGNTKIRRFSNSRLAVGSGITYADSVNDGGSFTINEAGVYTISYSDSLSSGESVFGITVNDSAMTTNWTTPITYAQGHRAGTSNNAGFQGFCSWTGPLAVGDIVRGHSNGNLDSTNAMCMFTICKIGV